MNTESSVHGHLAWKTIASPGLYLLKIIVGVTNKKIVSRLQTNNKISWPVCFFYYFCVWLKMVRISFPFISITLIPMQKPKTTYAWFQSAKTQPVSLDNQDQIHNVAWLFQQQTPWSSFERPADPRPPTAQFTVSPHQNWEPRPCGT